LKINKILISQAQPAVIEKSPYFKLSSNSDLELTFQPFMRIEGVSLKEFRSQRTEILDYSAVIFTSRTTIDNFFRICEEARITVPETMKYFCITEAIALYLQKYIVYRKRKIFFADGKFDSFMEIILKHKDERFILALSEPHNPEIPQTLEKLHLNFRPLVFAHTVSTDLSGLNISDYDILVFNSPNEISSLVSQFGTENIPMIVVLGENTAKAAVEAGLNIYGKAPAPGIPNVASAVELLVKNAAEGKELEPIEFCHSHKAENFIKAQEAKPTKRSRAKRKPAEEAAPATVAKKSTK
jgi:uroporphyrinogen-III synthase